MSNHLETIVALQHSLRELAEAEALLGGIPDWMRTLHDEHTQKRAAIAALAAAAEEASGLRLETESTIADTQEKLKKYQQQMSQVRTQREYGALLQEIDAAKAQIRTLEEQVLGAIEKSDEAQKALAGEEESFVELDARYAAELGRWEQEKPAVATRAAGLRDTISVLRERLVPGERALFERVYERHRGDALAPMRRATRVGGGPNLYHCGYCNFQVRPQVAMQIRSTGLVVQCDSCKKILFAGDGA